MKLKRQRGVSLMESNRKAPRPVSQKKVTLTMFLLAACHGPAALVLPASYAAPASPSRIAAPRVRSIYSSPDSSQRFTAYDDRKTGLTFDYPQSWRAEPDKDSLVKLDGTTGDGTYGEVKLAIHENVNDALVVQNILMPAFAKGLPEFKEISRDQLRFGKHLQYLGREVVVSCRFGSNTIMQRLVFFPVGQNVAALSFLTQSERYQKMMPMFDHILATVNGEQSSSGRGLSNQANVSGALKLVPYTDKSKIISFVYPEGWEIHNNDPARDVDLKFSGKNAQSMGAELNVTATLKPPGMTLEQFASTYEDFHLKPLKDYQKLSSKPASIGLSHNEGIVHVCTAEAQGHKLRQSAAIFADQTRFYAVTLTSGYWKESEVDDLFQRIISSVRTAE